MPEFILPGKYTPEFSRLSPFVKGYIEAMFFTDTGTGDDEEKGLEDASFEDLAPKALKLIHEDCNAFLADCGHLLEEAYSECPTPYDAERAGNDFWYTRNGHGVGFWDRGLPKPLSDNLCAVARGFGPLYLYRGDDELIYLS